MKNSTSNQQVHSQDKDLKEINCEGRIILPGIIDIHAHLRDMGQSDKETFITGTQAAINSGITTVFNMPNTEPPAITANQVKKWMNEAQNNIFTDVAFISGIPKDIDEEEIKKIIDLGVIGFKIYPLKSINGIDWCDEKNIQKILLISSKYQVPIFIHPDWPKSNIERESIIDRGITLGMSLLKIHDQLHPCKNETRYIEFILKNYFKLILNNKLTNERYPLIHFCHISCKESVKVIQDAFNFKSRRGVYLCDDELSISFEVTPHHIFLNNDIKLENPNFGKVLAPLRNDKNQLFLLNQIKEGTINFIGTDHAPHTIEEKKKPFFEAPSGFPGFETYVLLLLDKVLKNEIEIATFVKITSENPAKKFNLKFKGEIKESNYADLIIIEKVDEYTLDSQNFMTKAKYTPFENANLSERLTSARLWKIFLRGKEFHPQINEPSGCIILRAD